MNTNELSKFIKPNGDIDVDKIRDEALETLYKNTDNEYGRPTMYVITFMIHTKLSEQTMAKLTDKFVSSIPSEDWSKNMMKCDIRRLKE